MRTQQINLGIQIKPKVKKEEFLSDSHKKYYAKQIPITINGVDHLSVNTFTKDKRNLEHIFSIEKFHVDLDLYNVEDIWANIQNIHDNNFLKNGDNRDEVLKIQHDYVFELINSVCKKNQLPFPTEIKFSGRGYNIFWQIEATKVIYSGIHKNLRGPWKLANDRLIDIFRTLGADSAASDLARVFKDDFQLNPKSGFYSRTILENTLNLTYPFKTFTELLLDFTFEETQKYKLIPATSKQLDYINDMSKELGLDIDEHITLFEARKRIPQLKNQLLKLTPAKNTNRVLNICDYVLEQGNIKVGNRSNFLWCYSAGCKLQGLSLEQTEATILKLANSLNVGEKEALAALDQGYNKIRYPYLKTETIYKKLNLEIPHNIKTVTKDKNVKKIIVTRTSNKQVNYKSLRHIILMENDMHLSSRKLAAKYSIGKTKAAELLAYMRENKARLSERNKVSVNFLTTIKTLLNKVYFFEFSFFKSAYSNIGLHFSCAGEYIDYGVIYDIDSIKRIGNLLE